jgi:hypothetical protein
MKTYDQGSSLFWMLFSIYVLIESFRIGIGSLQNPGMGFSSFGASGLLGILSLVLFFQASLKQVSTRGGSLFADIQWKRIVFILIMLVIYSKVMPLLGYVISTFLLMTFLFWILERKKMWQVFLLSIVTTILTYFVFSKWLNCQFPNGPLGF